MPASRNEEDRMAIILKAQGLHKFAKMSVNIGKPNMTKIVELTRYVHTLARPTIYNFLGLEDPVVFMDKDTVDKVMFDPVFGFRWYYQEKGEMDVFGDMLLKSQTDVPLGTASEVAAVIPRGKGQMPDVVSKKELGMDSRPATELLKEYNVLDFHERKEKERYRIPDIEKEDDERPVKKDDSSKKKKLKLVAPWEKTI